MFYYRLFVMFAGERMFKIGKYLVKLQAVMLSLETVSCIKTVLRQFFGVMVLVLVLMVGVLVLVSVWDGVLGQKQDNVTTREYRSARKQHHRLPVLQHHNQERG